MTSKATEASVTSGHEASAAAMARSQAARIAHAVIVTGRSLTDAITDTSIVGESVLPSRDQALAREMAYGVVRWYWNLEEVARRLLNKPIRDRDRDVFFLILVGLYQLKRMRVPPHAAVDATVSACDVAGKPWAKPLVNGVLRTYTRRAKTIDEQITSACALTVHPDWLRTRIVKAWPRHWEVILRANNEHPPMALRVNLSRIARDEYLDRLKGASLHAEPDPHTATGITLSTPVAVELLPGFGDGLVSVQDLAAQLAAPAMRLVAGQRVLDACAAPGGKAAHILEAQPELREVVAIDVDAGRMARVRDTLKRLRLSARLLVADAAQVASWWDGREFDRILVDAPCSGTGVIRRHPDIKHHRRVDDIGRLCATQAQLLDALWPLVRPEGSLMYSTCSILPEENEDQIRAFLRRHPDARAQALSLGVGIDCQVGIQILPGLENMDGFFYSVLGRDSG